MLILYNFIQFVTLCSRNCMWRDEGICDMRKHMRRMTKKYLMLLVTSWSECRSRRQQIVARVFGKNLEGFWTKTRTLIYYEKRSLRWAVNPKYQAMLSFWCNICLNSRPPTLGQCAAVCCITVATVTQHPHGLSQSRLALTQCVASVMQHLLHN